MAKDTFTITRKIQLVPVGDKTEVNRVYNYIREGMKAQNLAMNQYISALYLGMQNDVSKDDRKELNNLFSRISTSKKGSAYDESIQFAKGLPIGSMTRKVKSDFDTAMKKGLKYGKLSLPTYKDSNPLLVHVDYVRLRSTNPHQDSGLYHNYTNHTEFLEHLYKSDFELFIKFANYITFKIILGNPHKSAEIRDVFKNIFEECYAIQGSSIGIYNNKIICNLSISIPKKQLCLDENIVVGVDLGLAVPAVCALNTVPYIHKSLGNYDDFVRERTKMQSQRKRLQKSLNYANGGHGRKKKLQSLERLKKRERNWVQTYNHKISKQIVDFAIKNKAQYINIEDLSGFDSSQFVLRNWSYFELQQFIEYKANKYGIIVRKINPYHTSQTCSFCGHWEEGQRISQSEFICKNPECVNHNKSINADYNAARNIAMSTDFVKNN
jgi:IS605 OrfB family transposase|nr:MAG TPA: endonuclease [Caudoviricetes sp.]